MLLHMWSDTPLSNSQLVCMQDMKHCLPAISIRLNSIVIICEWSLRRMWLIVEQGKKMIVLLNWDVMWSGRYYHKKVSVVLNKEVYIYFYQPWKLKTQVLTEVWVNSLCLSSWVKLLFACDNLGRGCVINMLPLTVERVSLSFIMNWMSLCSCSLVCIFWVKPEVHLLQVQ